ncbi:MAG: delta(24(24(1)))-sterol reductase [Chlamydiae bacterium CG10_big_fil_rev_8_21_14_0_10_42_34]|nr:MAG: delta(24(24(1)))-sterol reductase [Chlamydiae bacterium CG10_big_fil_rev_8_21_14_0_10_42_34]
MNSNTLSNAKTKEYEFGGPIGAFFIILFSHSLVYYLWISLTYFSGSLPLPQSLNETLPFLGQLLSYVLQGAAPTAHAAAIYLGFVFFQYLLARFVPGLQVKGLPVPSENNRQLSYLCNGIGSWYITLIAAAILNYTGIFPLTALADHMGSLITVGIIFANLLTLGLYFGSIVSKKMHTPSGNPIYDLFMGTVLNPRLGKVDIKLFAEIRIPWILLFFLTLSAAAKQYEIYGAVSGPMILMIVAHGLYTNACMKGEECIPTTWDIFHEKFGWMLIFWNFVGVPFVYCFQSFYILKNNPQFSTPALIALFALLLFAYYVWDTANSQKNRFRMQLRGTFVKRNTFPQLPWGTLKNPKFIKTAQGDPILVDGWYRYGRKIHYAADTLMALCWGLSCGFSSFLPYLYPLFFVSMIVHRYHRDTKRCEKKYGKDWDTYCKTVPYKFIPYVY